MMNHLQELLKIAHQYRIGEASRQALEDFAAARYAKGDPYDLHAMLADCYLLPFRFAGEEDVGDFEETAALLDAVYRGEALLRRTLAVRVVLSDREACAERAVMAHALEEMLQDIYMYNQMPERREKHRIQLTEMREKCAQRSSMQLIDTILLLIIDCLACSRGDYASICIGDDCEGVFLNKAGRLLAMLRGYEIAVVRLQYEQGKLTCNVI